MSHVLHTSSVEDGGPPDGWVPVERRRLGLDRQSLLPGLAVAVVGILLSGVIPFINDAVPWDNAIAAGDRVALGPQLVVTPPVGWQLVNGVRVGERTVAGPAPVAELTDAGVTMVLTAEALPGGVEALLTTVTDDIAGSDQGAGLRVDGDPVHLITDSGRTGVTQRWSSPSTTGIVAVIAVPPADASQRPTGVVIRVSGSGNATDVVNPDVERTLRSVARGEGR
ncbi:hypothetical protein [Pseudonocardia sp. GCM10023141]|uniref:hypothetical protein n=1 Tax=Pseudonocardia sp. GCM10023141 TaxID=3252653 RepID=UPI003623DD84